MLAAVASAGLFPTHIAGAAEPDDPAERGVRPMLADRIDRPLRYTPDGGDFLITNGRESFNRPLYGGSSAFRVDAGDRPEYSLYLPGRGGNLRLGIRTAAGSRWLTDAAQVVARYRAGSMVHEIRDPLMGGGSLAIPKQGFGRWTGPADMFVVDDSGLRRAAAAGAGRIELPNGAWLATPGEAAAPNIAFVSQWDNFPDEIRVPLSGQASKVYLLMAGSTGPMQSRFDNGEVIVAYGDGSTARLPLENPSTWWPIDQDYFVDDFAFVHDGGFPLRIDLKTGKIRVLDAAACQDKRRSVAGGAATVLDFTLDPSRELQSLTVRALANEVVIGLMSATLERP